MNLWEYDIEKTIHNYSYTLQSSRFLNRVFESDAFQEMDTESITLELLSGLRIISFKDHLKRYIYLKADLEHVLHKKFEEISDREFQNTITTSFKFWGTPYSMTPTTARPSSTAMRWLTSEYVKRDSIFLLGFGLGMTEEEVSEFLTKVINEDDFNFDDADEVIYWYCYHCHLPFAKADLYKQHYDLMIEQPDGSNILIERSVSHQKQQVYRWEQIRESSDFATRGEQYLKGYLSLLKKNQPKEEQQKKVYQEFLRLYKLACEQIAGCYNQEGKKDRSWSAADINPADLEKFLCCGIPLSASGNVKRKSSSLLSRHFSAKRMTRQTIDDIFSGKIGVNRFDLITLCFLISAIRDFALAPESRLTKFIDETNALLQSCRMLGLYSANAYECFLLLCLFSEEPLAFYSDVLEYTYEPDLLKK